MTPLRSNPEHPIDAPSDVLDSETPEIVEAEQPRESVETVTQLMDLWRLEYETATDDRKAELGYKIIKMGVAISASGLNADQVKIREAEPGVLGFYVPSTGEIAITLAGLELPPAHFMDVLVHEATHAGITGKKVADEGLTQIITEKKVAGAMSGIYEQEQKETTETFSALDMKHVIDTYDFEKPRELIELYLQTEWRDASRSKWNDAFENKDLLSEDQEKYFLEHEATEWIEQLEDALELAAPRLLERAVFEGFDFEAVHRSNIKKFALERVK